VGTVTTAVDSPALGRRIGLAILQLRAAQPGTRLAVAGGGQAEVHPLPFVPPDEERA
jgi:glycine cleavage system aminomethyltransferase T